MSNTIPIGTRKNHCRLYAYTLGECLSDIYVGCIASENYYLSREQCVRTHGWGWGWVISPRFTHLGQKTPRGVRVCIFIACWRGDVKSDQPWDAVTYLELFYLSPTGSCSWDTSGLGKCTALTHGCRCYVLRREDEDGSRVRSVPRDGCGVFPGWAPNPHVKGLREWISFWDLYPW